MKDSTSYKKVQDDGGQEASIDERGSRTRSGGTPGTAENRDPNDEKVMANSPDDTPGRRVEASLSTLNNGKVSPSSPIEAYYDFGSSKTVGINNPYADRADKIAEFLGNKDTVKA